MSEWGRKPVDKLDFGLVDIEKARLSWLKQKLHAPRSFDNGRIDVTRMPQELLKMPKFNLTDEQIDQMQADEALQVLERKVFRGWRCAWLQDRLDLLEGRFFPIAGQD